MRVPLRLVWQPLRSNRSEALVASHPHHDEGADEERIRVVVSQGVVGDGEPDCTFCVTITRRGENEVPGDGVGVALASACLRDVSCSGFYIGLM